MSKRTKARAKARRLIQALYPSKSPAAPAKPKRVKRPSLTTAGAPSEAAIKAFYASWEWAKLSYETKRDRGRRCECCGATPVDGIRIITDHVKPLRRFWHLRLEPSNMQVLCDPCNRGKASHDETDWRAENAKALAEAPDEDETVISFARWHGL